MGEPDQNGKCSRRLDGGGPVCSVSPNSAKFFFPFLPPKQHTPKKMTCTHLSNPTEPKPKPSQVQSSQSSLSANGCKAYFFIFSVLSLVWGFPILNPGRQHHTTHIYIHRAQYRYILKLLYPTPTLQLHSAGLQHLHYLGVLLQIVW